MATIQLLARHQAMAQAPAHRLGPIPHSDPLIRLAEVAAHRITADSVVAGDLNGVIALGHQLQHRALPLTQGSARSIGPWGCNSLTSKPT